jgi:Rod binding domain-containing protein
LANAFAKQNNLVLQNTDFNASDPNQYQQVIANQVAQCLELLRADGLANSEELLKQMTSHCRRWDNIHGFDARVLYPEFVEILNRYEY